MIDIGDRNPLTIVRRLLETDDLLHHGSVVAAATIVSGGVNYAYQVFMGRALGPEQFGVFGALFALFYLVNVLGWGIRFSASRFTTELDGREIGLRTFHRGFLARSMLLAVGLAAVLVAASPVIAGFLGLDSRWPVVVVAATVPFGLTLRANYGTFQGVQWFVPLGAYRVVQALAKFGLGVALVLLGYGIYGAFGAIVVGMIVALALTTGHLNDRLDEQRSTGPAIDYRRVYQFAPPAVLAGFCLTVPANVDVIVVKHFFSSQQAGLYTAASVLGKVLIFVPMGISTALFPKVTHDATGRAPVRMDALFDRAFLYSAAIAGSGVLVYALAPALVLDLFFGGAYAAAAPLLRWYGLAVLFFVLAVVVLEFELARDRMRFVYVFAAMSAIEVGLMWLVNGSMFRVVQVILVVNAIVLVYGVMEVKWRR